MRYAPGRQYPNFDPFGEPVVDSATPMAESERSECMAVKIGWLVFWSLAFLILAGRIYTSDLQPPPTVAAQAVQAPAFR